MTRLIGNIRHPDASSYSRLSKDMMDFFDGWIKELPEGSVWVEVGCWYGASILYVLNELKDIGKSFEIHVVDIFEHEQGQQLEDFIFNLGEFKDDVIIHHSDSVKASALFEDQTIDLCYIDGDHNYRGIQRDIEAWYPKVRGHLTGDDFSTEFPGVIQAVNEFAEKKSLITCVHGSQWELF